MTAATRWGDALLDRMRQQGDALADRTIRQLFDRGGPGAVLAAWRTLIDNDQPPPETVPAELREYFARTGAAPQRDPEHVVRGERVFADHGPAILALLCCYSLPAAFAARKGVQVLHRTAYIEKRPNRRLFQTAQMVVDVMAPGGLGPGGQGLRSAQKVRLVHAAIRHLIRQDERRPWDVSSLGVPINQEDLAATLMTFSSLVLDGLSKLHIDVPPSDREAYLNAWLAVGRIMGIDEALLPRDVAEAEVLTSTIERRQIAGSPEGRDMMLALLGMMEQHMPRVLHGVAPAMIREFLPGDVADELGVPTHRLDRVVADACDAIGWIGSHASPHGALGRAFSMHVIRMLCTVELGGNRTAFQLPPTIQAAWKLRDPPTHRSFLERIEEWVR